MPWRLLLEDIPQVRASKRSKESTTSPQPKKVSVPLEAKSNPSLQVKLTPPSPKKVNPFTSEFNRHKIRSKPRVNIPEVSAPNDRVILKARRPVLPRI
ncbi:hypothetical protein TNCV_2891561 [Trichonephila clavipes]|nr:hypothetical protein TNCV_2891561 [Trichonephila clavipes]